MAVGNSLALPQDLLTVYSEPTMDPFTRLGSIPNIPYSPTSVVCRQQGSSFIGCGTVQGRWGNRETDLDTWDVER